jgi:hypothetical protein
MVPVLVDEVVRDGPESVTDGSLTFLPLSVQDFLDLFEIGILLAAVRCSCGEGCNARGVLTFRLLSGRELG